MRISKHLSNTLLIGNLIAMILVVHIHYHTMESIDDVSLNNANYVIQQIYINGPARVSVPLFALVSGFFFYLKWTGLETYSKNIKQRAKSLLIPYLIVTFLILIAYISRELLVGRAYVFSLGNIIDGWLISPKSVQFWYIRDLLILVLISPLLVYRGWRISTLLGSIIFLVWLFDIHPFPIIGEWYLLNNDALLFFWIGGFLSKHKDILENLIKKDWKTIWILMLIYILLVIVRILIYMPIDIWYVQDYNLPALLLYKIAILVGLILLILIASKLSTLSLLNYLSGYSFFLYLFHLFPLSIVFTKISEKLVGEELSFYVNFIVAPVIVFFLGILCARFLPLFYSLITGGRVPNRFAQT